MDFTYFVAIVLSLLVGLVAAVLFVLVRGRSYWKLLASALVCAVIADFVLLLDWSRTDEMTVEFLLTDMAFFAAYGLVGCGIGTLVILGGRQLYRWARQTGVE